MKRRLLSLAAVSLALTMGFSSTAMAAQSKYFTDVNDSNYGWSTEYVDYLCEKGVANGTGNNKYSPELSIERGDFIVLIDKAFEMTPVLELSVHFSDVSEDMYYYKPIVNAKGNNIIKDIGAFYPETPITRADAMTMLYRAMSNNNLIKTTGSTDLSMYADGNIIKDIEVKNAIGTLTKIGVINGSNGYLNPMSTMTRAEMAVVFSKALQYTENINSVANNDNNVEEPVEDTEKEEITNASPVIEGEEITETLHLDGKPLTEATEITAAFKEATEAGAVVIVANETDAKINSSEITMQTDIENAVNVTENSDLEITDSTIKAIGNDHSAVNVEDGSSVDISGSTLQTALETSYALTNAGEANITDTTIFNSGNNNKSYSLINLTDNSETEINNAEISADESNGIFFINSNVEDSESTLSIKDSKISGKKSSLFKLEDKTEFVATIENCEFNGLTNLFVNNYSYSTKRDLPNVDLTLIDQELEINVDTSAIYEATITLKGDSYLRGMFNDIHFPHYVKLNLEYGSTWELTDHVYISALSVDDEYTLEQIIDNGYNIYYDSTLEENRWLDEEIHDLPHGGQLIPR